MALFLATSGVLEVRSALGETQTWDEGIHISSGYAYLTFGDYSWNTEHPPLVKIMSALPLRFLGLEAHRFGPDGARKEQIRYGIDFLYKNRRHADTILIAARGATILLTLLFTAAFAWWMRRRFGVAAALLATVLCAFDPNLIAHGRYVTTDVPLTAFYFFSCVLWVEYLERGGARWLLLAAAAIAIAMVVKFSMVVYWPETLRCWRTKAGLIEALTDRENFMGNLIFHLGHTLRLPAHAWLVGLNDVVGHNAGGHASYLLGVRSDKGWWYYFPVVFAVKSTVAALGATLLVFGAGLWIAVRGMSRRLLECFRAIPLIALGLALPPLLYFASSMTSGINLGMRHILPVYPFLYAGTAAVLARMEGRRIAHYAMLLLAAAQIVECARITPDYLAFFNTLAGGPGRGPEYLVDSNIDWGQDVKKLLHWLDAHGTRRARVFYFGNTPMDYYGLEAPGYPAPLDQAGWDEIDDFCVANVTPLNGVYVPLDVLAPLRMREPVAKVGWSMYVYDLRKKKKN